MVAVVAAVAVAVAAMIVVVVVVVVVGVMMMVRVFFVVVAHFPGCPTSHHNTLSQSILDVNAKNDDGQTALSLAVTHGHTEIVKTLLKQQDIDPKIPDGGLHAVVLDDSLQFSEYSIDPAEGQASGSLLSRQEWTQPFIMGSGRRAN